MKWSQFRNWWTLVGENDEPFPGMEILELPGSPSWIYLYVVVDGKDTKTHISVERRDWILAHPEEFYMESLL